MLERIEYVKICRNSQRFWVTINHVTRNKVYGTVNNYVFDQPFKYGDTIDFDLTEIVDILEFENL